MINLLTQFPDLKKYDLTSLEQLAYGGSPMAPELIHLTREVLPNLKLLQGYGLSEAGFLTGLQDHEHTENRLTSCGRTCPGIEVRVVDESGRKLEPGRLVNWWLGARMSCAVIGIIRKKLHVRSEMGCFGPETSAIRMPTGTYTSWTA